ncbi:MAG: EAL domain-containing protein [Candidatus Palauibacterales bacterium]|nr:EAL domain-containing protein [Candidatus Palauibacterales bacterium]MDP2528477.1 EAL domain-containing protein [Candidatus Palauibacterales bacterium]MDP2583000.1 EAL domain-containing protein [Candidatus Palauibacterales bacterium]
MSRPASQSAGRRARVMPVALAVLVCALTFAYDVSSPPFRALGVVPYVLAVLVGSWYPGALFPFAVAALSTVLAALGPVLGQHGYSHVLLVNRLVIGLVIWASAWLVWRGRRASVTAEEHARALHGLRTDRRRLGLFLEQVPAILWAVDRDLRFTQSIGAGLQSLGLDPGQTVGLTLQEFFGTDEPGFESIAAHRTVLEAGEPVSYATEWAGRHYRVRVEPQRDPDGVPVGVVGLALDVTDQLRAEETARATESRYATLFEEVQEAVYFSQLDGTIVEANRAFRELFAFRRGEAVGADALTLYADPEDRADFRRVILEHGAVRDFEVALRGRGGRAITALLSATVVRDVDGRPVGFQGIVRDVTRQRALEQELRRRALHDSLTDLPNRTLFHDRAAMALEHHHRNGQGLALLFVDLDGFKRVNDSLGHQAGDALLQRAAARLRDAFRGHDTVARVGGDEFMVLLAGLNSEAEAIIAGERLTDLFRRPLLADDQEIHLSASVGLVYVGPGASWIEAELPDVDRLVRAADLALYRAKRVPGPAYRLFHPEEDWTWREQGRLELENEIRRGILTDAFVCHYQPVVSLETGQVVGAEVLARWEHPQRGLCPPAEFIPVAEQTGLILSLGEAILRRACRESSAWCVGEDAVTLFVNLSPRQFDDPDLVGRVCHVLDETGMDPARLVFEVTETGAMLRPEHTARLRGLGCRVALDDFGTGYASLQYLKTLSLDVLKLDMSFTHGLPGDPADLAICRAVATLGQHLGLPVVAEGIESGPQRDAARSVGCRWAQGFFFDAPLPPEAMEARLARRRAV